MRGFIRSAAAILFSLTLAACGGGGGGSSAGGGGAALPAPGPGAGGGGAGGGGAAAQVVSLTGVVAVGTGVKTNAGQAVNLGAVAPAGRTVWLGVRAAGQQGAQPTISGVLPNAIIIAVDAYANTAATTADAQGNFTLKLEPGVAYAIIIIDPKTLQVAGSLVQTANTNKPGAIVANQDTNIGKLVVNPRTKKAVAEGQVNGAVQEQAAPAGLDQNGDGVITNQEKAAFAAKKPTAGGGAGGGGAGQGGAAQPVQQTVSAVDLMLQPGLWAIDVEHGAGWDRYGVLVTDSVNVQGPQGKPAKAVRSVWVDYYLRDPYAKAIGFYQANARGGNAYGGNTPAPQPDPNAAPQGGVAKDLVDPYGYFTFMGNGWMQLAPATVTLGQSYPLQWSTPGDPYTFQATITVFREAQTITLADGNAYPIYRVEVAGQRLVDAYGQVVNQAPDFRLFIVGGWGVSVQTDVYGTVQDALAALRFGKVQTDATGKFKGFTPLTQTATDPYGWGIPNQQTLQGWIAYAWNNRDVIGQAPAGGAQQGMQAPVLVASIASDVYGNPIVSPLAYDPAWLVPNNLTEGTQQPFSLTVQYQASNGATAWLEARVYDSYGQPVVLAQSQQVPLAKATALSTQSLNFSITVPTLTALDAYGWAWGMSPGMPTEGDAEFVLVVQDVSGQQVENSLGTYHIVSATAQAAPGFAVIPTIWWDGYVQPLPYDPYTYMDVALTAGVAVDFYAQVGFDPYAVPQGAQLRLELRHFDPWTGQYATDVYGNVGLAQGTPVAAGTSPQQLAARITVPDLTLVGDPFAPLDANGVPTWGSVELWVVMTDANGNILADTQVAGYSVQSAAAAQQAWRVDGAWVDMPMIGTPLVEGTDVYVQAWAWGQGQGAQVRLRFSVADPYTGAMVPLTTSAWQPLAFDAYGSAQVNDLLKAPTIQQLNAYGAVTPWGDGLVTLELEAQDAYGNAAVFWLGDYTVQPLPQAGGAGGAGGLVQPTTTPPTVNPNTGVMTVNLVDPWGFPMTDVYVMVVDAYGAQQVAVSDWLGVASFAGLAPGAVDVHVFYDPYVQALAQPGMAPPGTAFPPSLWISAMQVNSDQLTITVDPNYATGYVPGGQVCNSAIFRVSLPGAATTWSWTQPTNDQYSAAFLYNGVVYTGGGWPVQATDAYGNLVWDAYGNPVTATDANGNPIWEFTLGCVDDPTIVPGVPVVGDLVIVDQYAAWAWDPYTGILTSNTQFVRDVGVIGPVALTFSSGFQGYWGQQPSWVGTASFGQVPVQSVTLTGLGYPAWTRLWRTTDPYASIMFRRELMAGAPVGPFGWPAWGLMEDHMVSDPYGLPVPPVTASANAPFTVQMPVWPAQVTQLLVRADQGMDYWNMNFGFGANWHHDELVPLGGQTAIAPVITGQPVFSPYQVGQTITWTPPATVAGQALTLQELDILDGVNAWVVLLPGNVTSFTPPQPPAGVTNWIVPGVAYDLDYNVRWAQGWNYNQALTVALRRSTLGPDPSLPRPQVSEGLYDPLVDPYAAVILPVNPYGMVNPYGNPTPIVNPYGMVNPYGNLTPIVNPYAMVNPYGDGVIWTPAGTPMTGATWRP